MSKKIEKIPETRNSFVINNEHADMIVNDLLQGDYEALGHIFTDLVNLNLYGDYAIIENLDDKDKAERTARKLLKTDSEHYLNHFIARSEQNRTNRTAGQYPNNAEVKDYARAKGYDENIAVGWCIEQAQNDWKDQNGEPIKYWKKTLDAYMRGVARNRIKDMASTFSR